MSSRVDLSGVSNADGASSKGRRDIDEDFIACGQFEWARVGVLCDGMGGGELGEKASEKVARRFIEGVGEMDAMGQELLGDEESRRNHYRSLIESCHELVVTLAGGQGISGTTLTAVILISTAKAGVVCDIVNIGDSRCYRVEGRQGRLITDDHSLTGDMVRAGYIKIHEVEETSGRNVLTRNIGDEGGSRADVFTIEGDGLERFVLCCDGVWGPLHTEEGLWLPDMDEGVARSMVDEALRMGSRDNCSVLVFDLAP